MCFQKAVPDILNALLLHSTKMGMTAKLLFLLIRAKRSQVHCRLKRLHQKTPESMIDTIEFMIENEISYVKFVPVSDHMVINVS